MLYFVFGKKNKGMPPETYPVSKLVKNYLDNFGTNDICVSLPGFLGYTYDSITEFFKKLKVKNSFVFTEGMNGKGIIKKHPNRNCLDTIQETNNIIFTGKKHSPFKVKGKDHSKMIFFLDEKIKEGKVIVKAILIGSSNQNKSTYFANSNYGEADILIFNRETTFLHSKNYVSDKEIADIFTEGNDGQGNIVVSKEIGNENDDFLLNIFNDCLEYDIEELERYFDN